MVIVSFPGHIESPPDEIGGNEIMLRLTNKNRKIKNRVLIILTAHPPVLNIIYYFYLKTFLFINNKNIRKN
jgi:hypothetical protein